MQKTLLALTAAPGVDNQPEWNLSALSGDRKLRVLRGPAAGRGAEIRSRRGYRCRFRRHGACADGTRARCPDRFRNDSGKNLTDLDLI